MPVEHDPGRARPRPQTPVPPARRRQERTDRTTLLPARSRQAGLRSGEPRLPVSALPQQAGRTPERALRTRRVVRIRSPPWVPPIVRSPAVPISGRRHPAGGIPRAQRPESQQTAWSRPGLARSKRTVTVPGPRTGRRDPSRKEGLPRAWASRGVRQARTGTPVMAMVPFGEGRTGLPSWLRKTAEPDRQERSTGFAAAAAPRESADRHANPARPAAAAGSRPEARSASCPVANSAEDPGPREHRTRVLGSARAKARNWLPKREAARQAAPPARRPPVALAATRAHCSRTPSAEGHRTHPRMRRSASKDPAAAATRVGIPVPVPVPARVRAEASTAQSPEN